MRKGVTVFAGLVVCAFAAGNLAVSVSAAAAPAGAVPKSTASPASAAPPSIGAQSDWTVRTGRSFEPRTVDFASRPYTKHSKGDASQRPLFVRDPKAYATAKAHPDGKPGLAITPDTTSAPATSSGLKTPVPLGTSFAGLTSADDVSNISGFDEPPDTQIAVGPTRIVEMVNELIRIDDKAGNQIATATLDDWFVVSSYWSPTYFNNEQFNVGDPRVLYDTTSGRWFASLMAWVPSNFDNITLLGVSDTGDPNGRWTIYVVDVEGPTFGAPAWICDQPKVGVSSDKIVIGCSLFDMSGTFQEGQLMVMSKSRAMAGYSLHESWWVSAGWFGLVPAQNLAASVPTLYVAYNLSDGGSVSGYPGTEVLAVTGDVTTNANYAAVNGHTVNMTATNFPPAAPQNGSANQLDTGDDRFMSAFVLAGKLYTSGADSCTPAGDTTPRSCLRLVEVNLSSWTLIQGATAGLIGKYIIDPTLGVNSSGDVAFAYSTSSSTDYPDVENAVQPASDPNTFVGGQVVAGSGPYVSTIPPGFTGLRWGDYSSVAMDPSSTTYVWVAGEFSNGPSDGSLGTKWGTQVARFNAHIPQVCTATSLAPSVPSPQEPTADIILTATATCIDPATPDFQFWIKTPGTTTFSMVQPYGIGNTYDWASHVTLGTYTLEVRVRGTSETAKSYDSLNDISYLITATPCTLPTLDASPVDYPQVTGTSVTLTASTTCGAPPPLYQFWVRTPDLVFHLAQAYSASNVYNWNAFNTQVGNYLLQVRVKNSGSLGAYDNLRSISYSRALCTTPSLNTVGSPYASGSQAITLTASGACNSTIQYQFRYRDTANVWHVLQAYSATNTATWNADYKAGNYLLEVQTRPLGSIAAYVTFKDLAFTLSGCGVPTLTSDFASPQLADTTVSWTASAACSGTPQYKFMVHSSFCGAHANPWQYNFCGGSLITHPPSTFCTYFSCISSFWLSTNGYVVQCVDGKFSHSGGRAGVCSGHGGFLRNLYAGFWTVAQDWAGSDTLAWTPHYTGPYVVEVLVRNTGANEDAGDNLTTAGYSIGICSAVSLNTAAGSPYASGSGPITLTASGAACNSTIQYQFRYRDTANVWHVLQAYSATNTATWNADYKAGNYLLEVQTRPLGSTAAYVTFKDLAFTLSGCGVPTLTSDVASPQFAATTVTWTASATCSGTPQYKFMVRLPSLVWTLGQDWGGATFAWSSHATLGSYLVEVLVRNTGATEDAGDNLTAAGYSIGVCSAVSLGTVAISPYASGSGAITLTATGACHGTIQYQFLYRDPSLVYHVIGGYGSSTTASWNADYKAGNYLLQVRTRPLGSIAAYVTYTNLAFTLSGCGVPTLTPDLASSKVAGTTITWTGVATCTGTPQYKFLVRSPAGVWSLKQNWGADTFVWQSPATIGTYLVEVLVRNTGANEDGGDNIKIVSYVLK